MQDTRFTIYSFYLGMIVLGISATLLGTNSQNLTDHFGMPHEDGGLFITLQGLGSTITMFFVGIAYNKYRPRPLLLSGPLLLGIGNLIIGVAVQQEIAYIGALIIGFGFGSLLVGPNTIVPALTIGESTRGLNALNVFFGVGAVVGPQVVNLALELDNYQLSFLIAGILNLLIAGMFFYVTLPAELQVLASNSLRRILATARWGIVIPFGILLFFYVGTEVGFGAWIHTQMTEVTLADDQTATLTVSIYWGGLVIGRIIATMLAGRIQANHILVGTFITMGSGASLLLLVPENPTMATLSALVVGIGCGPVFPTVLAIISDTYPKVFATASGVIIAIGNVGAMTIPWVQGKVGGGESGGIEVTLTLSIILLIMFFYLQIRRNNQVIVNA